MESVIPPRVPPDVPPDLGSGAGFDGAEGLLLAEGSSSESVGLFGDQMNVSSDQRMGEVVIVPAEISKVSRGFQISDTGIAYWIVLSEVDLVFLKGMLGDNWVFRMFNEKLELGNSDLRVSFKSEADLEGFGVNFSVMLCVEGRGLQGCDFEQISGLFGSVQEILAGMVQLCGINSESVDREGDERNSVKFPQLEVNVNAFEVNSDASFVLLNKRKKRSIKKEGTRVKTCKVLWGKENYIRKAVSGSEEVCHEVLPDGAAACEMAAELGRKKRVDGVKEVIKKSGKGNEISIQGQQFKFASSVLDLKFSPGSSDGMFREEVPIISGNRDVVKGEMINMGQKVERSSKSVSMKKLIKEKTADYVKR
ncbi:hypothetical protein Hanom_Chr16g01422741 [Helianthus anomalus]